MVFLLHIFNPREVNLMLSEICSLLDFTLFCFSQPSRVAARDSSSVTPGGVSGSGGGVTGSTTAPTTRTRSAAVKVSVLCRSDQQLTPQSSFGWF